MERLPSGDVNGFLIDFNVNRLFDKAETIPTLRNGLKTHLYADLSRAMEFQAVVNRQLVKDFSVTILKCNKVQNI